MRVSEILDNITNKVKPYQTFITMIIFLGGTIWGIGKYFFSTPDLEIIVHKDVINYPSTIKEQYQNTFKYIMDSIKNPNTVLAANDVSDYLLKTKELMTLEIYNNTTSVLKSAQIKVPNVIDITSKAISSSYLSDLEYQNLFSNLKFEKANSLVTISNTIDIPPKENLKIYLWGDFYEANEGDIIAYYGNGTGDISYPKSFTGWKAFVADYFIEIFSFILLSVTLVYVLQTKKHANN